MRVALLCEKNHKIKSYVNCVFVGKNVKYFKKFAKNEQKENLSLI